MAVQFSYGNEDRNSTVKLQLVDERVKNNTEETRGKKVEGDAKYSRARLKKRYIALRIQGQEAQPGEGITTTKASNHGMAQLSEDIITKTASIALLSSWHTAPP